MKKLVLMAGLCLWAAAAEPKKIVVVGMTPEAIRDFQTVSPEIKVVAATPATVVKETADADALFGTINPQIFQAAHKLKWLQIYSAGVETYRFPEFIRSDIVLTN